MTTPSTQPPAPALPASAPLPAPAPPPASAPPPCAPPPARASEALRAWIDGCDPTGFADPHAAGSGARALAGILDLPLPGSGRTLERFAGLAAIGAHDLVLARLAEGHADALAICAELGADAAAIEDRAEADADADAAAIGPASSGGGAADGAPSLWAVWAADPPNARPAATRHGNGGWRLDGIKAWCSGAAACTHALVTAHADDGYRLFAVSRAGWQPVDGSWPAYGMAGSDSRSVTFSGTAATPVGGPGDYLTRPGFWHGGAGVAAVWYGGAVGVARALTESAARRALDDHALAHLGAVDVTLHACWSALAAAAAEIDVDPADRAGVGERRAARVRALAEHAATDVTWRVGRALGAAPLALDARHSRRVADLAVFVRQTHGERDLARLGALVLADGVDW